MKRIMFFVMPSKIIFDNYIYYNKKFLIFRWLTSSFYKAIIYSVIFIFMIIMSCWYIVMLQKVTFPSIPWGEDCSDWILHLVSGTRANVIWYFNSLFWNIPPHGTRKWYPRNFLDWMITCIYKLSVNENMLILILTILISFELQII